MSLAGGSNGQETITLTLNGREVQAQPGQTILEVARAEGVDIPTLCYDSRLEAYGACRMCLVEVEGARGPMAACGTKVTAGYEGADPHREDRQAPQVRAGTAAHQPPAGLPGVRGGRRLPSAGLRLRVPGRHGAVGLAPAVAAGSRASIRTWPTTARAASCAAVACASAGKSCPSVAGATSTGATTAKSTPRTGCPLLEVGCVSCGQCVSTCPVGAIVGQRAPLGARAWQTTATATTCSYCADGCRLVVHSFRDRVVRIVLRGAEGPQRRQPVRQGALRLRLRRRCRPADRSADETGRWHAGRRLLGRRPQGRGRQDRRRAQGRTGDRP